MGQDPSAIREQIEQTRDRMGDTVDALGYKADVPARTKDSLNERVDTVKSKIAGVTGSLSDSTPDSGDVAAGARRAAGVAQENPLGLAIGAAAVGFLAGMLIPSTSVEDERIGPVADQIKEQAKQTGQEALEHGKQVAQDTVQVATDKAQESTAEVVATLQESAESHAGDLADSAKNSVSDVKTTTIEDGGSNG
jgi:gas vesicle protein